jgi:carbonic anhydrase
VLELTDRFRAMGIERSRLPENLNEFFGLFASERQNVLTAAGFIRQSPLIGPNVPVHGLLIDIQSGRLEWVANGYETLVTVSAKAAVPTRSEITFVASTIPELTPLKQDTVKLPTAGIGEKTANANQWLGQVQVVDVAKQTPPPNPRPELPKPPVIRPTPKLHQRRTR